MQERGNRTTTTKTNRRETMQESSDLKINDKNGRH